MGLKLGRTFSGYLRLLTTNNRGETQPLCNKEKSKGLLGVLGVITD